jgi:hypothetical protein
MRNKPKTNENVLAWKRTLQDDGWEVDDGEYAGYWVLDEWDEDDFIDACDNDGADPDEVDEIAELVWG